MNCFSWEGEDVLVRKIMLDIYGIQKGFYVDVGAHHPFDLSNTALLYQEGWRGINIDAMPESMNLFNKHRPEDTNLEIALGGGDTFNNGKKKDFFIFENSELNGFLTEDDVKKQISQGNKLIRKVQLYTANINSILDKYANNKQIDILNIDIEGLDYLVLKELNFDKYRPKLIIAESLGVHFIEEIMRTELYSYLNENKYRLFSRLHFSTIYVCENQYPVKR